MRLDKSKETFEKSFNKKGQVTVFIIIGILIVIIAGMLLYVNREKISITGVKEVQVEPIKDYLEECVKERIQWKLDDLRKKGGRDIISDLPGNPFRGYSVLINTIDGVNYNLDLFPTINKIEDSLSKEVKQYLVGDECSLNTFKNDFDIIEDKNRINVYVRIPLPAFEINERSDAIEVFIDYPISIKKGESSVEIKKINFLIEDDFGEIYDVVNRLLMEYTLPGSIRIDNFGQYCADNFADKNIRCEEQIISNWKKVFVANSDKFPVNGVLGEPSLEGVFFEFVVMKI